MTFQSAVEGPGESVQYMDTSSTITVYSGGSRSWRCNNPGLLGLGVFALQQGALGKACGAAAFGDYATGKQALVKRLASEDFQGLTVEQAYRRFKPGHSIPGPPPPTPKQCPYTGLSAAAMMASVGDAGRRQMAEMIERDLVGFQQGTVTKEAKAKGSLNKASLAPATNITINGRTAVHAGSQGVLTTPDVCKTPTPSGCKSVMYMNVATSADAAKTASSVTVNGNPVCHKDSTFALSSGDEAGSCGGVMSGTIKGKAEFLTASQNVFHEGKPAARAFDLMVANNRNTPPMPLMQPTAAPPTAQDAGDVEALNEQPPAHAAVWERSSDEALQGFGDINADEENELDPSGGLT